MTLSAEHLKELVELAEGFEASAYAEGKLAAALEAHRADFNAGKRDTVTMRQLRICLDAEATVWRSTKSAAAIRAALTILTEDPDERRDRVLETVVAPDNAPVPDVLSAEAAIAHVERYLEDHSRERFGKDDLTFLTWELEPPEAFKPRLDWKSFDYAEAERRALLQYKDAMARTKIGGSFKRSFSMYDGSAAKALEDLLDDNDS